jgi:Uma2 family endonuclease
MFRVLPSLEGSIMAITARRLTVEDLDLIPEEHPGDRHELIDGELFVSPVPTSKHQDVSLNLTLALGTFIRAQRLGRLYVAPSGVRLHPHTLVVPDLHFIASERLHIISGKGTDGPPDLIIEILSPSTRQYDLSTKRALYARFGVPEYWIVDPIVRSVTVLTLASEAYEALPLLAGGAIESRVLPDLKLTLEQIFEDIG